MSFLFHRRVLLDVWIYPLLGLDFISLVRWDANQYTEAKKIKCMLRMAFPFTRAKLQMRCDHSRQIYRYNARNRITMIISVISFVAYIAIYILLNSERLYIRHCSMLNQVVLNMRCPLHEARGMFPWLGK
jgi:hypothetical protein